MSAASGSGTIFIDMRGILEGDIATLGPDAAALSESAEATFPAVTAAVSSIAPDSAAESEATQGGVVADRGVGDGSGGRKDDFSESGPDSTALGEAAIAAISTVAAVAGDQVGSTIGARPAKPPLAELLLTFAELRDTPPLAA